MDMSAPNVKICGLSQETSVSAALAGGASHIGFIFFDLSPRNVSPAVARILAEPFRGRILPVAVTVDADDAKLDDVVSQLQPAMLQLHGKESPRRVGELRGRFGVPVMKAIPVAQAADLRRLEAYADVADMLLLDAKPPPGARLPGGNGVAFDWSLLAGLNRKLKFMLSGGIDIDNVADAIRLASPWGIDVSSGVESAPGVKDEKRIRSFLHKVKSLDTEQA